MKLNRGDFLKGLAAVAVQPGTASTSTACSLSLGSCTSAAAWAGVGVPAAGMPGGMVQNRRSAAARMAAGSISPTTESTAFRAQRIRAAWATRSCRCRDSTLSTVPSRWLP